MSATLTLWTGLPSRTTTRRAGAPSGFIGLKTAGMLAAAPLIGLAFIVGLPIVGLALLAATAARALMRSSLVLHTLKNVAMFFCAMRFSNRSTASCCLMNSLNESQSVVL